MEPNLPTQDRKVVINKSAEKNFNALSGFYAFTAFFLIITGVAVLVSQSISVYYLYQFGESLLASVTLFISLMLCGIIITVGAFGFSKLSKFDTNKYRHDKIDLAFRVWTRVNWVQFILLCLLILIFVIGLIAYLTSKII